MKTIKEFRKEHQRIHYCTLCDEFLKGLEDNLRLFFLGLGDMDLGDQLIKVILEDES